jgi:hypothetical protein
MDYDNNYMKREDLDYLADMVSLNIIRYLETLDWFSMNKLEAEEELLAEMARLMTLLSAYEEKGQYEKCAIIQNKIDRINNKLNK